MKPGPIAAAKARAAAKAQERVLDSQKATMKPGPPAPTTKKATR